MTGAPSGLPRALVALDDRQREAATALRGPVRVLAGAGTGKTRVITHRIAYGVDSGEYSPQRVMAVTFTTRAAGEMRGRLRALGIHGVSARTFHSAALAQVNYFWPTVADGETAPPVVPNKVRLLADAAASMRLDLDVPTLRDIASGIEWRKVAMRTIDQFAQTPRAAVGSLSGSAVAEVHAAYERLKDQRRQLDFEDILLVCAGMLETEPRVARAVHEQYRHFTVDEYQDVSPLQHHLLHLWLGVRTDLCVVGDASQTIYSFAGADPRYLLDFPREHPDAVLVELQRNHRSGSGVLDVANQLMRGRPGALTLVPADAATPDPAPSPTPIAPAVSAYDADADEAAGVARAVRAQLDSGVPAESIAILYRAHTQSSLLQAALADRGVAASVLGGRRFFDLPEVREALLMLRGESVAHASAPLVEAVRDILRGLGLTETPPEAGGALRDAWESRAALLRLAEAADEGTTLRQFTDDLQSRARDQHEPALRTVTLATLHAAKGLEWDHVHIMGLSEGLLPISYARTLENVDEERRLLYVGITRARRGLSLSWARGSGRNERLPSRFLEEIGIRTRRAPGASAPRGGGRGSSPNAPSRR